jgi:hypothetical protein
LKASDVLFTGSELLLDVNPLKPANALAVGAVEEMSGGGGFVGFNCTLANGLTVVEEGFNCTLANGLTVVEGGFNCTLVNNFFAADPSLLLVVAVLKAIGAIGNGCTAETADNGLSG